MAENSKIRPIKNAPEITAVQILPGRNVRLTWCDAVGAEKYVVIRYSDPDGERIRERLEVLGAEFNSYTDTSIDEDGSFEYKIIAKKKIAPKQSAHKTSAAARANIISVDPPELSHIENDGKKIKISWNREEGIHGYVVLRRFSFMKKAIPIATLTEGETEFTDGKFAEGQLIYYSIQSIVSDGESLAYSRPSNELCSVVLPIPVVTKKHHSITKKVNISVRLCAGASGYILFRRSEDDEPVEITRTEGIAAFTLTDGTKKPKGELFYSVACYKLSEDGDEFIGERSEEVKA